VDVSDLNPANLVHIDRQILQQLALKLLQRKGMFAAEAQIVTDRMIEADLEQRSSEGIGTLPEYLDAMDLGDIDPRARMITVSETPAIALLDGSTGMGHVATTRAMELAVQKASTVGTGTVVVRNCRPCGDLGGIVRLAAVRGLIGLVATSFDTGSSDPTGELTLAWAIPGPEGRTPLIQRGNNQPLIGAVPLLCGILSAGMAGADPSPRKRKAVRAANTVEYTLMAISPDQFGTRDAFLTKWNALWPSSDTNAPVTEEPVASVPLTPSDATRLAELAGKIKFDVSWS
jgi:LDH2 family malate/lactate/ureidoglycolate dehydrogenase